jgi:hypothetical protein
VRVPRAAAVGGGEEGGGSLYDFRHSPTSFPWRLESYSLEHRPNAPARQDMVSLVDRVENSKQVSDVVPPSHFSCRVVGRLQHQLAHEVRQNIL